MAWFSVFFLKSGKVGKKRGEAYIEEKYSEEWLELIHKREEYEKASFLYNKVNENQRRQDLRKALKE